MDRRGGVLLKIPNPKGDSLAYTLQLVSSKAREQAESRGHVLGVFTKQGDKAAYALCMRCDAPAIAYMNDKQFNDVSGKAVETVCTKKSGFEFYG